MPKKRRHKRKAPRPDSPAIESARVVAGVLRTLHQTAVADGMTIYVKGRRYSSTETLPQAAFMATMLGWDESAVFPAFVSAQLRSTEFSVVQRPNAAEVSSGDALIAELTPTAAVFYGVDGSHEWPDGNYFVLEEWPRLLAALRRISISDDEPPRTVAIKRPAQTKRLPARPTERRAPLPVPDVVITPQHGNAPLIAQMVADSDRLRKDRNRAFGHVVELSIQGGRSGECVLLHPVRTVGNALELPFTYREGTESAPLEAALRLRTPAGAKPLALAVYSSASARPDVDRAWALALRAAVDLTCITEQAARTDGSSVSHRRTQDSAPSSRQPPRAFRAASANTDSNFWVPQSWTPTGRTHQLLGSYVVGHIRRIPGSAASDLARREAAKIGITLPLRDRTWVQPFLRADMPAGDALTFDWSAPADLRAQA